MTSVIIIIIILMSHQTRSLSSCFVRNFPLTDKLLTLDPRGCSAAEGGAEHRQFDMSGINWRAAQNEQMEGDRKSRRSRRIRAGCLASVDLATLSSLLSNIDSESWKLLWDL